MLCIIIFPVVSATSKVHINSINTLNWEQRKFGDLADYKKGPFGSAITKDMFVPKGDGVVKVYEQQNAINKPLLLHHL